MATTGPTKLNEVENTLQEGWRGAESDGERQREEMLRKTIESNSQYAGVQLIDWEKRIKEHRLGIEK